MNPELDPVLERWLSDGPTRVPDRVVLGALERIASAPQQAPPAPWRSLEMSVFLRLAAASILAITIGGFLYGGSRLASIGSPATTSPTPSPTAVADEGTDILATTKAEPLPPQATCPPGSDPDAPGPVDQARPQAGDSRQGYGAIAFDRHTGRVILLTADPEEERSQTWTYDVCTNAWQRMSPAEGPVGGWGWGADDARLVYDVDSDRTVAFKSFTSSPTNYMVRTSTDICSYDLAADRWAKLRSFPWPDGHTTYGTVFYHDPSGLIVIYDGATMWAYDVDSDTLSKVRQRPDPSQPAGSGLPQGKIALGYDPMRDLVVAVVVPYAGEPEPLGSTALLPEEYRPPAIGRSETWTFEPGTGVWHREGAAPAADLIVCGVGGYESGRACYPTWGRAVHDEVSGLTLFIARDWGRPAHAGRVDAWDADERAWRTLFDVAETAGEGPRWCQSTPAVYDPVNGRTVCLRNTDSGDLVSAFSTTINDWRWLLGPAVASPAPGTDPSP